MDIQEKIGLTQLGILAISMIVGIIVSTIADNNKKVDKFIGTTLVFQIAVAVLVHIIWGLIRLWTL